MPKVEFGSDGIRGVAGEWPFTSLSLVHIGQALGQFVCSRFEHPVVVVGRDTRPSGEDLLPCLIAGLTGQGIDVIDLGVMTTPGVAFVARWQQANLGVIVSASHNPLEYSGIKVVGPNGLRLQREEEIEIESLTDGYPARAVECAAISGQQVDGQHLIEFYIQDHIARCPAKSLDNLRLVLDCANGAASRVAPEVFHRLGAQVLSVNDDVKGKNINYRCGSEYTQRHPESLVDTVRQHCADYGFAFDGDGDRLIVVDGDGRVYDGNDLLFVLATYFHSKGLLRNNTVVTTSLANRGLIETLDQAGIKTVFASKGDKNLEAAMWGGDYLLGSEPGGNVIINDGNHTAADAVYAALVLSGVIVSNWPSSLAALTAWLQRRPQVTVTRKLPVVPTLEEALQEEIRRWQRELGDSRRVLYWRSATEPGAFRVMVEGDRESTQEQVTQLSESIYQALQAIAEQVGETANHSSAPQ